MVKASTLENGDAKKSRERKILDLIYAGRHVEEITPTRRKLQKRMSGSPKARVYPR
jgi:hypothetical protein